MTRILLYGMAFSLLTLSGTIHGLWTGRWGPSADLEAAAARCDNVPMTLGDWEGKELEIDPRQLTVAEVVNHVSRQYANRHTGQTVSILLICGRPGPISVHTPDVCYRGVGYEIVGKQENHRMPSDTDSPAAEFQMARFSKQSESLRIFWSWRDQGPWTASNNRLTFARSGFLYKLYVIHRMSNPDEPVEEDPSNEFLRLLLPELQRCLSPVS